MTDVYGVLIMQGISNPSQKKGYIFVFNSLLNLCVAQSVVVKGLERSIANLYEARRLLLGLDFCEVSMATKNTNEMSLVSKSTTDPLLANSGITNYWLNMLMQKLHLTEAGVCVGLRVVRGGEGWWWGGCMCDDRDQYVIYQTHFL